MDNMQVPKRVWRATLDFDEAIEMLRDRGVKVQEFVQESSKETTMISIDFNGNEQRFGILTREGVLELMYLDITDVETYDILQTVVDVIGETTSFGWTYE